MAPTRRRPAGMSCLCAIFFILVSEASAWQQPYPPGPDQGYWTSPYARTQSWPYYDNAAWGPAGPGPASGYGGVTSSGWNQQPVPPTYQHVTSNHQPVPPTYQHVTPNHQPVPPTYQHVTTNHQPVPPTYQHVTTNHQPAPPPYQQPVLPPPHQVTHQQQPGPPTHQQPLPTLHHVTAASQQESLPPTFHRLSHRQAQQQTVVPTQHQQEHAQPPGMSSPGHQHMAPYQPAWETSYAWDDPASSPLSAPDWERPPPHHAPDPHDRGAGHQGPPHHGWDQPMLWNPPPPPSWDQPDEEESPARSTRSSAPPTWVQDPSLARPVGHVVLDGRTRVPVRDYRLVLEHYLQAGWRDAAGAGRRFSDFGEFERAVRRQPAQQVRVSAHAAVTGDTYCRAVRSALEPDRADAVLELPDGTACPLHQLAGRADMAAWLHALFPPGLVPSRHHGTPHVWTPAPAAPAAPARDVTTTTPPPPTPPPPSTPTAATARPTAAPERHPTPTPAPTPSSTVHVHRSSTPSAAPAATPWGQRRPTSWAPSPQHAASVMSNQGHTSVGSSHRALN